ncbi:hypothetical protein PHYSODRAFT_473119 [Phytophthora sojae]|uniref:Uncharacterized protein n=1 Tax=Phytophthora sojae (strain P6497) TaxID=1094619 RepID=G4YN00_PHYSP|nr:hypothetical protein PHYSODRAFT_473119 [Phytophthora sojae]EGZ29533.1 hypothetical protein PHYSODRAFT_473119 [Phytophthora sojae]|eukprot:XP_009516808.1 hypothetical protein PHYSODRAFT_473119 [Phytophthora sojae]
MPLVSTQQLYQLLVQPIVKETLNQGDTSGNALAPAVMSVGSFNEIVHKIWEAYAPRVKTRAVKTDGVWSTETPEAAEWAKVMQFKLKKHVVDPAKTDQAILVEYHTTLVKLRGQTVSLLIYEYGVGIVRAQDLDEFKAACIHPEQVDRAGATAEVSLREIVANLQVVWAATFQGEAVVWRMWGNHIIRNLNRSTWETAILDHPPASVASLLRPADSTLESHLANVTQSANVALDCVQGALEGYRVIRRDWEALDRRLEEYEHSQSCD